MLPSLLPHMNSPEELEKLKGMMVRLNSLTCCHTHCNALRMQPNKVDKQPLVFFPDLHCYFHVTIMEVGRHHDFESDFCNHDQATLCPWERVCSLTRMACRQSMKGGMMKKMMTMTSPILWMVSPLMPCAILLPATCWARTIAAAYIESLSSSSAYAINARSGGFRIVHCAARGIKDVIQLFSVQVLMTQCNKEPSLQESNYRLGRFQRSLQNSIRGCLLCCWSGMLAYVCSCHWCHETSSHCPDAITTMIS
jgi:hypothetical protein